MRWYLKVVKQTVLTRIPFGTAIRRFKRKFFGYEPDPENLLSTLENLEEMEAELNAVGRSFEGAVLLEVGSGWFPAIPIMLALKGIKHIFMTDLTPHMDVVTFESTLHFLKKTFPENQRLQAIYRLEDLPVTYVSPFDASKISDASIDLVISRTVLEHIPQDELIRLLEILRPKLARDGLMVHLIDYSDHLEHSDKTISTVNFLTWSEHKHAFINLLMREGENRLRHHEYKDIFHKAGFSVLKDSVLVHEATREIVKTLPLAKPYCYMSAKQLAGLRGIYILAPAQV